MTPEANLKAWFSGSKIVDSGGNPLRLYHGTERGPMGEDAFFVPGQGGYIYTTPDPDYAEAFNSGLRGQTFPLYARAMNPLDLRTLGEGPVSREQLKDTCGTAGVKVPFGDESAIYKAVFQWVKMWGFKEACEDAGYDAIWLRERAGNAEGDALLLFDSWQLKSAIGNRGTYDKEDPRLIASQDDDRTADWLYRHNIHVIDGKVTFYHATPKETAPIIEKEGLREGSLLEDSPERAIFYARRDRELPPEDVVCFSVTVQPSALRYGIWPSAREAIPPALLKRVSLDAKTASSFTLRQEPSRGDFLDSLQNVTVEGEKSPISRQSSEEATYYHVTPHSKTPRILAQGLVTGKPRQWKNPLGAPLGERDRIYLHTDLDSAIQFGFRMQWDTQRPVDILQIAASIPDIELDPHIEAQMRGTWVMTSTPITPDKIKRVIALTPELVQDYVARDQAKYRQASGAPTLRTSNPGGEWLQEQQKASKEGGTDRFGCPRVWGAVTASFTSDVLMPVNILATIPGMRGEQGNVRPDTMSWMMENMGATKRLPQVNDQDYTPFIMVDCNGRPWVNEGNHRIMTAARLGWPYLPVEVRYFAGGEQAHTGIMAPRKVLERHAFAIQQGYAMDNYATRGPLNIENQKQATQATDLTQTPEFKAWFKESEVVDAEGKPLVVIHQTDVSFTTFLRKHLGQNTMDNASDKWYAQTSKIGFWFASSDAKSMHYMPGDIQMEVYLSLQNPVYYPTLAHLANLLEWERLSGEAFRKRMMAQGYDGLVIEKDEEIMGRSYVAFHSNQIKSVTNVGRFDPKKRSIMAGPIQKSGAKLFQKRRADAPPVTELQKSPAQRVQDAAKAHPLQSPEPTDPTRTPEFQAWFRDSKVVDRRGRPRVVYHGSTHAFDKFDMSRGNEGNFYGKGFYFTDSKEDVNSNYGTNQGRDLQSRIDERAEELMNSTFTEEDDGTVQGLGRLQALELARKEIAGQSTGMVYLTYLRIVNPVIVQPRGGTHFEGVSIDPKDEDNIIESRQFVKLYKATLRASEELGARGDRVWEEATQDLDTLDGFTAFQFEQGIRQGDECMEVSGGPGPLIARIWQLMGFDGIIMDAEGIFKGRGMDMSPGTQHYIVWNPRQVKSAIGNSGAFNPRSKRLVAEDLLALLQKKASV